jgi:hypothetical protein
VLEIYSTEPSYPHYTNNVFGNYNDIHVQTKLCNRFFELAHFVSSRPKRSTVHHFMYYYKEYILQKL